MTPPGSMMPERSKRRRVLDNSCHCGHYGSHSRGGLPCQCAHWLAMTWQLSVKAAISAWQLSLTLLLFFHVVRQEQPNRREDIKSQRCQRRDGAQVQSVDRKAVQFLQKRHRNFSFRAYGITHFSHFRVGATLAVARHLHLWLFATGDHKGRPYEINHVSGSDFLDLDGQGAVIS